MSGSSELADSFLETDESTPEEPATESPHWGPFLKDLQVLDLHSVSDFNAMLKLLWGDDCAPVREVLYDFISLARSATPLRRQILMMALKSVGQVSLMALEQVSREFEASTRKHLVCIESLRAHVDTEHWKESTNELDLMPDLEAEALADIETVFSLAYEVTDHMLEYVMRWFAGQDKSSQPMAMADWVASQTFQEFGNSRIEALCKAAGFTSVDTQKVQRYFTFMSESWSTRRVGDESPWKSDISDDHTPFELSIALEGSRPEIRFLIEAQNNPTTLQTSWDDGVALNERLNKEFGLSLDHFYRVKDLFEPKNPDMRFSLWHAFCLKPDGRAEVKVYLNPQARGPEHANAIVEEALHRLGFANAWRFLTQVVMRRGVQDQVLYFSLDMGGQAVSRVKIYVAHRDATPEDIEFAMSHAKEYSEGEARAFCEAIQGDDDRFSAQRSTLTCWAFTSDDDARPYSATLHCPIRCYADNDRDALRRVRAVLDPRSHAVLDRCVWALANRPLEAGVGLIQWASMRREGGKVRATFYLATEAYGTVAPRKSASHRVHVPDVLNAEIFQLSA
ncbi:tryptophan dimethylallyltransferase family protein [Hyalangium versicolor]|uniref:tryptophan dimethylallyltransferase family protein n=1 Tax=Hyalangium versicolor TaxID=2861190 RepID=UPI001CCCBFBC|nr:tryptophan dimethylallyltransferase family protein [Hyalangium versicolor]